MKKIALIILLYSTPVFSRKIDYKLLMDACLRETNPDSYCTEAAKLKKYNLDILETFFNEYSYQWQRELLTVVYYGVSNGKIPFTIKIAPYEKFNIYVKKDDISIRYLFDF